MNSKDKQALLKKFGIRLAVLRTRERKSLRHLAAVSRIDPSDIQKYEKGLVCPSLITIATLAKALDVEPRDLLTFEDPQAYKHQIKKNNKYVSPKTHPIQHLGKPPHLH